MMPNPSGTDLVDRLRRDRLDLRVLFMSGYAESMMSDGALPSDVDLLQKPYAPRGLLLRVREPLGRRPAD